MHLSKKNQQLLKYIVILFIGWRLALLLISFFGLSVFPILNPGNLPNIQVFNYYDYWVKWANWDGAHFRGIAELGYQPHQVVFFPLFPILIKVLLSLSIPTLFGGLIISHLLTIVGLFFFYKLVRLDSEDNVAQKSLFLLLAFPTSFYFGAVYSEALFFCLAVLAFYYARKKNWLLAAIFAGLSAVTRLTGLIIIVSLIIEYLFKPHFKFTLRDFFKNNLRRFLIYFLVTNIILDILIRNTQGQLDPVFSGALLYIAFYWAYLTLGLFLTTGIYYLIKFRINLTKMKPNPIIPLLISILPFSFFALYLYQTQHNPLVFINYESGWGRSFSFPWQLLTSYVLELNQYHFFTVGVNYQLLVDFLFTIIFLTGLIYSFLKLRLSYSIYYLLSLLLPLFSGTLSAMPRYGLLFFPLFILLAQIKNPLYLQLWTYFSIMLLGFFTILFINSYWVT